MIKMNSYFHNKKKRCKANVDQEADLIPDSLALGPYDMVAPTFKNL